MTNDPNAENIDGYIPEPAPKKRKINFKQPKYILPLIILPFILFVGWQVTGMMGDKKEKKTQQELSTSLGDSGDSILGKSDAYDAYFDRTDDRTMLGGLDKEGKNGAYYSDDLTDAQKRQIDSLKSIQKLQDRQKFDSQSYYEQKSSFGPSVSNNNDRDFQRSADLIKMLNEQATGRGSSSNSYEGAASGNGYASTSGSSTDRAQNYQDPVKMLKSQMLVMDSLDKAKDPAYQEQLRAEERLRKNREKLAKFMNNTLRVQKATLNPYFNTISNEERPNYVKAIIDENTKGYLGSRIRFRLLEDIYVDKYLLPRGTLLYGNITGFNLQRVNLNIVTVLYKGEILPINLTVFDLDGQKGMYIPSSAFREMTRELGSTTVQGMQMNSSNEGFFSTIGTKLFTSVSQSISNMLRKNKAKLKYNSFVYLINEKDLKRQED